MEKAPIPSPAGYRGDGLERRDVSKGGGMAAAVQRLRIGLLGQDREPVGGSNLLPDFFLAR
jgi:hypothetical protein